ncbi:hypothetical protein [Sinanaerobacter chloroacetimidivorans]|uniref:Uncharacterized protein n=1 Tax=Sinanaerobacter chloroacetimidivorans TaxID=2818044 RepID=A0A8J8B171_9FIRM|nr:hypothetical protein [Sinanaerobacter chloroacetimidivorans]MBR0597442.1 hypothetical protein [Sinanaerobacter chloroacetimidivorans]
MSHKLSFGDVYIFNAKDPHKISAISEKNIILTIQIDLDYYKKFFRKLDVTYFICDSFINRDRLTEELRYLRFLMTRIYDLHNEKNTNEVSIEELVKSLLSFLTDQFQYYTYSRNKTDSYDIFHRQEIR